MKHLISILFRFFLRISRSLPRSRFGGWFFFGLVTYFYELNWKNKIAMLKERTENITVCDICDIEIRDTRTKIEINGFDWDLCHSCWNGFNPFIVFLTIKANVKIDFKVKK